ASLLISNEKFLLGYLFAALMPVAMVAPYFTEKAEGDSELAYSLMMSSTILAPIVSPLLLFLLAGSSLPIQIGPLVLSISLFVALPLIASICVNIFFPRVKVLIQKNLSLLNSISLAALIFILFGSVISKININ